jgi:hypothetical protein
MINARRSNADTCMAKSSVAVSAKCVVAAAFSDAARSFLRADGAANA